MFYVDAPATGSDDHEPLLVIHGFPTSSFDYADVLPALAAHRRVVLMDMVGCGLSSKPDVPYTIALQADVVEGVVAATGARPVRAADPRHGRHRRRRAAGPPASTASGRSRSPAGS